MIFDHVNHEIELPKLTRKTTEKGRRYFTPEGKAYPSITTVLSILNKDKIQEWRKKVGEDQANRISQQAATRGTAVHSIAEDYLNNKEDYSKGHMPSNLFSFKQLQPILDERVNNVWMQETFLYSDRLECAGQVDCIAEFDGKLSIIDFKTSRKPKKEEWITNYFIQASFYSAAFYERTGIAIKQGVILITVDGSEPQVFTVNTHEYLKHFLAVRKKYKEIYNI
jgi:genome maintenance exonuclease 1